MGPTDDEFAAFIATTGAQVQRALVAAHGAAEGRSASQAALTWAWEHWDRVAGMRNPAGYLYRVGVTATLRGRPRDIPVADPITNSFVEAPDVEPELVAALDGLPPQQRAAVLLVHGHGYTLREVGAILDLNPSTVRVHVQRGLTKLRKSLEADHAH